MSGVPVDQAARTRAVEDRDGGLAVEAGAGTGKTRLIIDRVLHALASGALTIDRLAAITFTRRAAAELRGRLRREIDERLSKVEGEARRRLSTAQRDLPLARISTVHSFCAHLLRGHALAAGLDPDFVTRDDDEEGFFDELWPEWFEGALADRQRAAPIHRLLAWGGRLGDFTTAARLVFENPDCELPAPGGDLDFETIWREFRDALGGARDELREQLQPGEDDKLFAAVDALCRDYDRLAGLPADVRVRWLLGQVQGEELRLPGFRSNLGRRSVYRDPDAMFAVRARLAAWREKDALARLREHFRPTADGALALLRDFRDWARQTRKDRKQLDFVDQLFELRELLKDEGVARRVRAALDELLVDEFQDTDPLMADIFDRLTRAPGGPILFVVGDPKQSIYRFRRADVVTYMRRVERFRGAGRTEHIVVNFRSAAPLLSHVDALMNDVFTGRAWPVGQAAWESLRPCAEPPAPRGPVVVLAPVGDPEQELSVDDVADLEASALAAQLCQANEEGFKWRHMAVLFPKTRRAYLLEAALDRCGVPHRQEKARRFFMQPEVAEIVQTLSAVADPHEPLFVVASLRSRFFGFSDAELARHRAAGGSFSPLAAGADGDPDIVAALARIAGWHAKARRVAPPALLETILGETQYREVLARWKGGGRALANVQRLVERLRAQWDAGGADLGEIVDWLRVRVTDEDIHAAESPAPEEDDRVALLTIHGAKGLEWPLVALFDLRARPGRAAARAVVDRREQRLTAGFSPFLHSTGFAEALAADALFEEAERARMLYVATTRAKERLVLPVPFAAGRAQKGSLLEMLEGTKTWADWSAAAAERRDPELDVVVVRATAPPPAEEDDEDEPKDVDDVGRTGTITAARAARELWLAERRDALIAADQCVVTRPSALHTPGDTAPPAERPRAREIGSAVHEALFWLASGAAALTDAAQVAGRAADEQGLSGDDLEMVRRFVARAVESPLVQRALDADGRLAEAPFSWPVAFDALPPRARDLLRGQLLDAQRPAPRADQHVTVEGIADLVFRTPEGLVVVDYKTDPWSTPADVERLIERYAPQIELYGAAFSAILRQPVAELCLLFLGGPHTIARQA